MRNPLHCAAGDKRRDLSFSDSSGCTETTPERALFRLLAPGCECTPSTPDTREACRAGHTFTFDDTLCDMKTADVTEIQPPITGVVREVLAVIRRHRTADERRGTHTWVSLLSSFMADIAEFVQARGGMIHSDAPAVVLEAIRAYPCYACRPNEFVLSRIAAVELQLCTKKWCSEHASRALALAKALEEVVTASGGKMLRREVIEKVRLTVFAARHADGKSEDAIANHHHTGSGLRCVGHAY